MKTISLKKVAVVAVASLGFGLLSVVPATASTITTATATVSAAATNVAIANGSGTITVGATLSSATANNDVLNAVVTVVGPSAAAAASTAPVVTCTAASITGNVANAASNTAGGITFTDAGTVHLASGANTLGTCTFPTALVGPYVVTVTLTPTTLVITNNNAASTTIYAGYDAGGTLNTNKAWPTVGSNTTTGWAGTAGGIATLRVANLASSTQYYVTIDKGSIISGVENDTGTKIGAITNTNGTNLSGGFGFLTAASNIVGNSMDITVSDTGGVASTTVTVSTYAAGTGAATTFVAATVTWGVAAAPSAQYSTLGLNALNGTAITTAANDTTSTVVARTANTQQFNIMVAVKDQYNVNYSGFVLGASISGPGTLGLDTDVDGTAPLTGRSLTATLTDHAGQVSIYGDGTSGKATVTITATTTAGVTTVLGSKTVTFAGSAAKAVATQNLYVAAAGSALGLATPTTTAGAATSFATTPAFSVEVMDSAGIDVIAGSTVKMTSSDSTVITVGTCAELTASSLPGNFECSVSGATGAASGKSATVTFSVLNSTTGLYDIVANALTFTVGGAISKVVVSTDKTSYTAGEGVNLTATATDSSGNKAYDGQAWQLSAATKAASNKSMGGTLPAETAYIVNGKKSTTSSTGTASLFAPSTPGSFTIAGTYAATVAAPLGTEWSVTASVADGNAAIITQIDALNAKIVALNALIAKIMKKLGVK